MIDPAIPRCALVTGSARRLGRAMALALAADGFDVVLHGRQESVDLWQTAAEVRAQGRQSSIVMADLADPAACSGLLDNAQVALGPIGVLVNSASTFPDDRLETMSRSGLEAALSVDLIAPLVLSQAFARQLPDDAHGVVVNLLDQKVLRPTLRRFSYTIAKSALWTATRMMARELAPRIRVAGIGPGIAMPEADLDEATLTRILDRAPLGQAGSAEEVVAALRYLLAANSVTGQMILVDGGMHLT
jgi:NAD(P)-dependent dehydrogenase (short-subunit alcohol dehydrogenase family)